MPFATLGDCLFIIYLTVFYSENKTLHLKKEKKYF